MQITRRLDGLLHGDYLGLLPGTGSEAGESREYRPGDDVRRMDWPVTARTTVAHVRHTVADRELEAWLCVDLSASMEFGTARTSKRDLVLAAAAAVTYLTVRGGNRVGALITDGVNITRLPPRTGRTAAHGLLRDIIATTPVEPHPGRSTTTAPQLSDVIAMLRRPPRRRGLIVVISDFLPLIGNPPAWERPLRALAARHEVLAIEVGDPRERELPNVGILQLVDPETGAHHEVNTRKKAVREAFAAAAITQRADIAAALRRSRASHLRLSTDSDWLLDIVRFVASRRRGLTSGGAA